MAIRQKENGKYIADVRDEFRKKHIKTFNTKGDAKAFEANLTKKKYDNRLVNSQLKNKRYLMDPELDRFEQSKQDLRPLSVKRYKYIISQIRAFTTAVGVVYVDEFTTDHAMLFKEELTRERIDPKGSTERMLKAKPKTVNFYLATIKAFFTQEFVNGNIEKNPMLRVKNVRVEKKKADYFTVDELKAFFAQKMNIAYRHAFMGFLLTGMRFNELANLKWSDINLRNCTIYVHSQGDFVTKTHNAERIIPFSEELLKILLLMTENKVNNGLVFLSPKGCKLRERSLLAKCKAIALLAKIESRATLHKFRHTYATLLIHRGVSIQNIKELLGHSSVVQTEIYAHNKSDHLHLDVSKLNNVLNP